MMAVCLLRYVQLAHGWRLMADGITSGSQILSQIPSSTSDRKPLYRGGHSQMMAVAPTYWSTPQRQRMVAESHYFPTGSLWIYVHLLVLEGEQHNIAKSLDRAIYPVDKGLYIGEEALMISALVVGCAYGLLLVQCLKSMWQILANARSL
jgi:hypothetical protein